MSLCYASILKNILQYLLQKITFRGKNTHQTTVIVFTVKIFQSRHFGDTNSQKSVIFKQNAHIV